MNGRLLYKVIYIPLRAPISKDLLSFRILSYVSTFLPLFYISGTALFADNISKFLELLIIISYTISIYSLLHLGKSFGISPVKRKLVTTGPYLYFKHPAYIGYFFSELCITLLNFSLINCSIFIASTFLYITRASRESRENKIIYS